jgi:selenocysteine lyase/cysteine desulfurase
MDKRSFLKTASLAGIGTTLKGSDWAAWLKQLPQASPGTSVTDEKYWKEIRGLYKLKPDYINLENGYYNFVPQPTLDRYIEHIRMINFEASHYMRTVQFENKNRMAAKLATVAGCTPQELVITRNTTEALDLVISGQDWKSGDEAVFALQDYGAMQDMFEQIASRYGVQLIKVSVPNIPLSDDEVVSLYEKALTSRTKLLMVSHMVNITGQILPIAKISAMAHRKSVPVLVDGAHAFGHFEYRISELGCDYYGTSLHKWMSVPLGAGFLYVKKEKIPTLWPLIADNRKDLSDILRLNHIGTHPCATDLAIEDALDFYQKIGGALKEQRLHYLQNYWTSKVQHYPKIVLNTPTDNVRSCGIANVGIAGLDPNEMAKTLLGEFGIFTVGINYANVVGCRICPNVYTTLSELDVFVAALKKMADRA